MIGGRGRKVKRFESVRPNLLISNKEAITSLSIIKPFKGVTDLPNHVPLPWNLLYFVAQYSATRDKGVAIVVCSAPLNDGRFTCNTSRVLRE